MSKIHVKANNGHSFKVTVEDNTTTTHTVTVDPDYYEQLTGGRITPTELVEKSFRFLLDREPNTAILSSFNLPVIADYFPDYEKTIAAYLD